MLQKAPSSNSRYSYRRWIPALSVFALSLTLAVWQSSDAAYATVIEFSDDGSPVVTNLVEPDVDGVSEESPSSSPVTLRPRKLSKLNVEQLVFRKLASDTALRYSGSDGVKAAGLDALTFVDVFTSLIHRESNFDPKTVSDKGAKGLGQLLDETAKDLGVSDPFDARQNLEGSARYLTQMLKRFGSLELALAAYNAGPSRVEQHNGVPPFRETRQYVVDIFHAIGIETDLAAPGVKSVSTAATPPKPNPSKQKSNDDQGVQSVWEF